MKITSAGQITSPARTNAFLRWCQQLSFSIGILAFGYVGFVLVDAKLYQTYYDWRFQQDLEGLKSPAGSSGYLPLPSPPPIPAEANRANAESFRMAGREGSPLGRIEISAIGLEVMILEGTGVETLRRGVGHIPGTAQPGQAGNVAIAGHRDTFFRGLRNIQKDDEIVLTTLQGSHRYRVESTQIVESEDIGVLNDSDDAILTLVTCYPFYFVGSAPQRFIVRAHKRPR
jgi:sortase A